MPDKISLLDEIRKGGYEASLITTFNAYLPFYEEVVLRRLLNAGMRHNVLMMDANQYAFSLKNHPPKLAGRQYSLVPVGMPGAFHPKLYFLAGKSKGLIIVGSHNMTLAGFGFNKELSNVVRVAGSGDIFGIALAAQAWQAVKSWINSSTFNIPSQVMDMVNKVQDFAPWLNEAVEPEGANEKLLIGQPGNVSIWNQLLDLIGDRKVTNIAMTGAFFDSQLGFVKQAQEQLKPTKFTIALDPQTVQMPALSHNTPGVSYVNGQTLGVEDNKSESNAHYLHAKGLYIETENGDGLIVSGSANPSTPAWQARNDYGNAELMLARYGTEAGLVAKGVGLSSIDQLPVLSDDDWSEIAKTWESDQEDASDIKKTGMAIVEDDRVIFDIELIKGFKLESLVLLGHDGNEVARTSNVAKKSKHYEVAFPKEQLLTSYILQCQDDSEVQLELLLHHASLVAEQARTGVQKRFKEALMSLETDTPDIGLLIDCIDKIVFSETNDTSQIVHKIKTANSKEDDKEATDLGTLAIDVSETRKHHSKKRLEHHSDFGYLLDALIYRLRLQEDKSIESLDKMGRSEEEQVGADDDEDSDNILISESRRIELLDFCHKKVRLVVRRMIAQLKAYVAGKKTLDEILVRLLGVLAVLRELRRSDRTAVWVGEGKTTVPHEERYRLFEEVMFSLFEGKTSLLHLEALGESFEHSDDISRLKGLLVWLAWDCGLTLDLKKPFMESPEQLQERLKRNAMMLALAQSVRNEDIVIDEAKQSIGSLTTSEMDWLKGLQQIMSQCDAINDRSYQIELAEASEAEAGDIAVHKNLKNWDLRIISSSSGKMISVLSLSKDKGIRSFSSDHLMKTKLESTH